MTDWPPTVLVFDVNETLLDLTALEPLFDRIFGDPQVLREWFAQQILYSMTVTLAQRYLDFASLAQAVLRMVGETRGVTVTTDQLTELRASLAALPAHADAAPGLAALRNRGYRLVTLTNSPRSADGTSALDRAGLGSFVERQFSVDDWQQFKPAPELYRGVAAELGVPTSACMLVAAHAWDTIGAQAVGYSGAFLARAGNAPLHAGGVEVPTLVVGDVVELGNALPAVA
jgi:2-haloacid dehalogenase